MPLLKSEEQEQDPERTLHATASTKRRKRQRRGILGVIVVDQEDEEDYVPEDDDSHVKKKKEKMAASRKIRSRNEEEMAEFFQKRNSYLMTILPPRMTMALQMLLERSSPQLLTYHTLSKYFVTRRKVAASKSFRALGTVGGTNARGIASLLRSLYTTSGGGLTASRRPACELRSLHLQAHTRLSSSQLLPLFKETIQLEEVCLRGCISVTSEAIKQLVKSNGHTLQVVNLNWTGVGLEGVEEVIRECPNLRVLKVAHVRGLTDSTIPSMMERISRATIARGFIPLGKLKKLKLHGTEIGNLALGSILKHCGSKLDSLDIANTHVGGMGCSQILFLLLGLEYELQQFRGTNATLRKLNLSGLSLPDREIVMFASNIHTLSALENLTFNEIRSYNQGGGYHDLSEGVDAEDLQLIMSALALSASRGRDRDSHTIQCGHQSRPRPLGVDRSKPYHFENLAVSNRVIGAFDLHSLKQPCHCGVEDMHHYAIKHLDLRGLNLTKPRLHSTSWLGCQSLNLADCKLLDDPDWQSLGAGGLLRRIDLSRTVVSEAAVERLLAENPYLTSINLTGCRGISVTRRRAFFLKVEQ
ncbi:hypothetical protein CBS101457_004237 [Exobasidium rhododendri]|nr:hypothetical protein CBS101457_004237 [Exobasidium rhododendri]